MAAIQPRPASLAVSGRRSRILSARADCPTREREETALRPKKPLSGPSKRAAFAGGMHYFATATERTNRGRLKVGRPTTQPGPRDAPMRPQQNLKRLARTCGCIATDRRLFESGLKPRNSLVTAMGRTNRSRARSWPPKNTVEVGGVEPPSVESSAPLLRAQPSASIRNGGTLMASFPLPYLELNLTRPSQNPVGRILHCDAWVRRGRNPPVRRAAFS